MKTRDLADLAFRNLREAILRNSLTTLGVAVGVASLVAMLSLGVGLQELASKRLSQSGLFDTIFVTPKNNFRGMGRPQREVESDKPPRTLDEDARKEIEKLPNVIEVYPQVRFFTEVRFNNKPFATVVAGMPESSRNSGSFDGMQGEFLLFANGQRSDPADRIRKGSFGKARIADRAGPGAALCGTPGAAGERRFVHPERRTFGRFFRGAEGAATRRLWASWKRSRRPDMAGTATRDC